MALDVRTLYFVLVLSYALFGFFQIGMWRLRPRESALLICGVSNLLTAAGNLLLSMRGEIPDVVSIGGANTLLFLGYWMLWAGLRRFHEQPVNWWFVFIPPFILGALYGWYEPVAQNLAVRVLLHSIVAGIFFLACLMDARRAQKSERLVMRQILMTVSMMGLGFIFLRILVTNEISVGSYVDTGNAKSLLVTLTLLIALLWNLAIVFMVSERMENTLTRLAHRDALTSLLNRAGFRELALRQLGRSVHARQSVSVLIMDIDYFKRINDEHGHDAGDELLNAFAKCTQQALRPTDLLARYGGEEFCALLPNVTLHEAETVAERVRKAFEVVYIQRADKRVQTTVSIGVAQIQIPQENIDSAISRADQALYEAKRQGRNRVMLATHATAADPGTAEPSAATSA